MVARKPLIAGNWKMHGRRADLAEMTALAERIGPASALVDVLICPPAPYIAQAAQSARLLPILVGAQDCSPMAADAARTGEISAAMLAEVGAHYVIVGHSERRQLHVETNDLVRAKAEAAIAAGLAPVVCVGETRPEREAGRASAVVAQQVAESVPAGEAPGLVVAYEPVWAIGGDRIPTTAEITEVHGVIRATLAKRYGEAASAIRVLYGGSVSPKNATEVFSAQDVDGALVGRASLKAADFAGIILAHPAAS
jgi:triosephosphate isomerase (TIM)